MIILPRSKDLWIPPISISTRDPSLLTYSTLLKQKFQYYKFLGIQSQASNQKKETYMKISLENHIILPKKAHCCLHMSFYSHQFNPPSSKHTYSPRPYIQMHKKIPLPPSTKPQPLQINKIASSMTKLLEQALIQTHYNIFHHKSQNTKYKT